MNSEKDGDTDLPDAEAVDPDTEALQRSQDAIDQARDAAREALKDNPPDSDPTEPPETQS